MSDITALIVLQNPMRAHYLEFDNDGRFTGVEKREVVAFAAMGGEIYGVRWDPASGRGVLAGSPGDEQRDHLLAVLKAGISLAEVAGCDERVRAVVLAELEEEDDDDE